MKKHHVLAVVTLLLFAGMRYIKYPLAYWVFGADHWQSMDHDVKVSWVNYSQIVLILTFTAWWFRRSPLQPLGLDHGLGRGLLAGFLCTLPMWIGYAWINGIPSLPEWTLVHRDLVLAGFYEELAFRGFAFGLLFGFAGWGFIPALLLPSLLFGLGHLYQADNAAEAAGIFLFTALANAGFAWFYVACGNLWMVIFLHGFMDLAWDMNHIAENVTGNPWANVFRFITLGLAIAYSIIQAKRSGVLNLRSRLWTSPLPT